MKKLLILLMLLISIVYCQNCTLEEHSLKNKEESTSFLKHKNVYTKYRSDVPKWLLQSI